MFIITIMIMMTIFRHCLCHDHLVDIVVILVVGAKSHDGPKAKTVRKENLKYHQPSVYDVMMTRIVFEL